MDWSRHGRAALAAAFCIGTAAPACAQFRLEIVEPARRALFHPGDTVAITVRTARAYRQVRISGELVKEQALGSAPYRFSFTLPRQLDAGYYDIFAWGDPGSPGSAGFDIAEPFELDVEPVWGPSADGSKLPHDAPGVTVDTCGTPLRHRAPVMYPPELIAAGIEGSVVADLTLDADGRVDGVYVRSGPEELGELVRRSAMAWHYAAHVGTSKDRQVRVTFSRAAAARAEEMPVPLPRRARPSSGANPVGLFRLKKIAIIGLSPDDASLVGRLLAERRFEEGEPVSGERLERLRRIAERHDRDLETFFSFEGSEVSVAIVPGGFFGVNQGQSARQGWLWPLHALCYPSIVDSLSYR